MIPAVMETTKNNAAVAGSVSQVGDALASVTAELDRVAKALERQNSPRHRFAAGVIFGLGTAIGASIIATLLIGQLSRVLNLTGLDLNDYYAARVVMERQIQQQTPQD
jgi:hypothetical protein